MANKYDKLDKEDRVLYCKDCLSIKIKGGRGIPDYCDECSSTDIDDCSIEEWQRMFIEKYGYDFYEGKDDEATIIERKLKELSNGKRWKNSQDD